MFRRQFLLFQWLYSYIQQMLYLWCVYISLSEDIMCAGKQLIIVWISFSMPQSPARGDRWDEISMFCVYVMFFFFFYCQNEYPDHILLLISDSVTRSRVWLPVFPAACRRSPWRCHSFWGWLSRSCPTQGWLDQQQCLSKGCVARLGACLKAAD